MLLLAFSMLSGCRNERAEKSTAEEVAPPTETAAAKKQVKVVDPPADTASAVASAAPSPKMTPYYNDRFGFSLSVPSFLVAQPAPENGDGRAFVGRGIELRAWGMNAVLPIEEMCTKQPGSVAHQVTKTSCFSTGVKDERIFWERTRLAGEVFYSIRFEYPESMKAEMDPVVTAVHKSWTTK